MSDFIISEHVVNENVCKLESKDFLNNTLTTCMNCLNVFKELRKMDSNDPADYDEFLLPETDVLLQFAERRYAIISVVNNVLNNALEAMDTADLCLDKILDEDTVTSSVKEKLKDAVESGISYLSTFIFYEFLNTPGYDEIVVTYCGKHTIDIDTFIKENVTLYKQNRRSLGVFNDYPEMEQPFLEIVGPALSLIPEDALTVEDVTGVISGDIPLETLLEKLGISEDDDDKEEDTLGSPSSIF